VFIIEFKLLNDAKKQGVVLVQIKAKNMPVLETAFI
jgi:hypothetical protein